MSDRLSQDDVKELEQLAAVVRGLKGGGDSVAKKDITWPHGTDGLLTSPGVRPDMYNLTPRVGGFIRRLPMLPSIDVNERFEFITGVTAQTGENPTTTCGTPPKSGKMKVAQILATYGEFFKGTDTINITKAGLRRDRSDVIRRLRNPGYDDIQGNVYVPVPEGATGESFNTIVGKTFLEFGQGAALDHAYVLWRGDKTKTNAQTYLGFITEFDGFDKWIKTGYRDVISNALVPSLDSQVITYNATLGADYVLQLSNLFRTLMMEATLKNTPNAHWEIVLHPRSMFPIFDLWACNYQTARCLPTESNGLILNVTQTKELADQMYRGQYLLIDGEKIPVSFDFGIEATQAEGGLGLWTSDTYVIPMDDGMGNPLSYMEYLPRDEMHNKELAELMGVFPDEVRVMNGGLYLMGFVKSAAFCFDYHFTSKTRLIVERPDLAGRIDNVSFTSQTPFNDPFPNSTYHKDGGSSFRSG